MKYRVELTILDVVISEEVAEFLALGFGFSVETDKILETTVLTLHCEAASVTEAMMKALRGAHSAFPQEPPCATTIQVHKAMTEEESSAFLAKILKPMEAAA
jgi:hypothetical protein